MFGARLKEERDKNQLSQEALADYLGMKKNTVWNWENEKTYPNALQLMDFLDLGFDVQYILTGTRSEQSRTDKRLPEKSTPGLSEEEQELLALFRQSSELGRAVIMSAARGAEKKEAASAAGEVA